MEIKRARRQLKKLGYKLQVRTFSHGPHATILDMNGTPMPSVFHGSHHLEKWKPAIDWKKSLTEPITKDGEPVYGLSVKTKKKDRI